MRKYLFIPINVLGHTVLVVVPDIFNHPTVKAIVLGSEADGNCIAIGSTNKQVCASVSSYFYDSHIRFR